MNDDQPTQTRPAAGLFRPSFLVVAGLLLVAAVGLQTTVAAMQFHFKKLPVPLAEDLRIAMPAEFGPWRQVGPDIRLSPEMEEELGTEQYIQRIYIDTAKARPDELESINGADEVRRKQAISTLVGRDPSARVYLHMAYYTGGVDTVPHIPDRCMVASGFATVGAEDLTWDVLPEKPGRASTDVTLRGVGFEQPGSGGFSSGGDTQHVAYFFQVNGNYAHDPLTGVRQELAKLTERHGYFCKIELMSATPDQATARTAMKDFLGQAMPAIEAALPDWEAFKRDAENEADGEDAPTA